MALIKCSECGKEISDKAKVCPHCGYELHSNQNVSNNENKKGTYGLVGMILGLCSIIAWFIPLFGYPCTILGIIFSTKGLDSENKNKALAGLILSILFLIITLINSLVGVLIVLNGYY